MAELTYEELSNVNGGATGAPTGAVPCILYTVKPGDCLSVLAQRYGTTVDAIMAVNSKITNRDKIYVDQKIYIPYKG